ELEQIPSMYSAIKHNGQPLYKLARQGIAIERASRKVIIYSADLIGFEADSFTFQVKCSKGTYIRTLVEDMGEVLGCGAHVAALRRLQVENFQSSQMQTLPHLEALNLSQSFSVMDAYLLPIDSSISGWPELSVSEAAIYYLKQGQAIIAAHAPHTKWVRLVRK